MSDQDTNTADAAALDAGALEPGQEAALADTLAAIDPSVAAAAPAFLAPGGGGIVRVSTDADGTQADGPSRSPAVSRGGRFVAFSSSATNLAPDEGDVTLGIFVKDLRTGAVQFASAGVVGPTDQKAGPASYAPSLSASGRFVAFQSQPSPGVGAPEHNYYVYVDDLRTGQLALASADADGNPANASSGLPSISASGRFVAFDSGATNLVPGSIGDEVFVKDLRTGQVQLASTDAAGNAGNGVSLAPSLSASGRFVAFDSGATNLVPGADGGVFVKDLRTGAVQLASAAADGTPGRGTSFAPSISGNGRLVAFGSYAANLVPESDPAIPPNSRPAEVFLKDLDTGRLTLLSAAMDGTPGDRSSSTPAISPNGRFVAFESRASNLAPGQASGDAGVFLKDLQTGELREVATLPPFTIDQSPHGTAVITEGLTSPAVTNTGVVAFSSAVNLVPGDPNKAADIFLAS